MKVKIEIDCDNYFQVFQHLHVIKKQLRKKLRKDGIKNYDDMMNNEPQAGFRLADDNCYGEHILRIKV